MKLEQLSQLLKHIRAIGEGDKNITSITLVGSAARNEMLIDSGIVRSDIELLVVVKSRRRRYTQGLTKKFIQISGEYQVDIDFSQVTSAQVMRSQSRVFYQHMRTHGKTIYGDDVCKEIAEVHPPDLDAYDVNNICIYQALKILTAQPHKYNETLLKATSYLLLYNLVKNGYLAHSFAEVFSATRSRIGHFTNITSQGDSKIELNECAFQLVKEHRLLGAPKKILHPELHSEIIQFISNCLQRAAECEVNNMWANLKLRKNILKSLGSQKNRFRLLSLIFHPNPRKKIICLAKESFHGPNHFRVVNPPAEWEAFLKLSLKENFY